jgi:hypothetical protein
VKTLIKMKKKKRGKKMKKSKIKLSVNDSQLDIVKLQDPIIYILTKRSNN